MSKFVRSIPPFDIGPHVRSTRGSGMSTAFALRILAEAVAWPEHAVTIRDHFNGGHADKFLMDTIRQMAADMHLEVEFAGAPFDPTVTCKKRGKMEMQYVNR
ncbi:hypothetical protein HOR51_gp21 [Ralstonia phage phiAp1]|uniref:Uncharacterized protein n=1 Tax=Ralstonia phage phiAp1 TaxID=2783867 RepID=A0A1L7DS38_9CAUD|nr:hypothetical protein HOR51_gp21 [Ralstonia phage phiAp1]APU03162.1 hypothetical protein phiAp1_21 [Ralstonia phage phiAp1]